MAVEELVGGVQGDICARHIPNTVVLPTPSPGVLYHVVRMSLFIYSLAVDKHDVIIGKLPIIPLFLLSP